MLSTGAIAFAEEGIMPINLDEEVVTTLESTSKITREDVVADEKLTIADDALIFDNSGVKLTKEDVKTGASLTIFKDENGDVLAIIVVDEEKSSFADVDLYGKSDSFGDLINAKNDLALNIAEETEIVNAAGEKAAKEELEGKNLVVFYSMVAMSLPAQTSPTKIVVLETKEVKAVTIAKDKVITEGDVVMLPLREVAEGLDFEVAWDNTLQKVTVGTTAMGVNFSVGENKYNKARMMPTELEKAPELVVSGEFGITYVPMSFFTQLIEAEAKVNEDGSVTINL